jgi:hypothetical protein
MGCGLLEVTCGHQLVDDLAHLVDGHEARRHSCGKPELGAGSAAERFEQDRALKRSPPSVHVQYSCPSPARIAFAMHDDPTYVSQLPEHPGLRELAQVIESAGMMGEILDARFRCVFISSEAARAMGVSAEVGPRIIGISQNRAVAGGDNAGVHARTKGIAFGQDQRTDPPVPDL